MRADVAHHTLIGLACGRCGVVFAQGGAPNMGLPGAESVSKRQERQVMYGTAGVRGKCAVDGIRIRLADVHILANERLECRGQKMGVERN